MAIRVYEAAKSRHLSINDKTQEEVLDVFAVGSTDQNAIYQAVLAATTVVWDGLIRKGLTLDHQGGGFWEGKVTYGPVEGLQLAGQGGAGNPPPQGSQPGENDPLGMELSFDTTGGTSKITQALATTSITARAGRPAPTIAELKNAIGAKKDHVEGCDVVSRKLEFGLSRKLSYLTLAYLRALVACTGSTNANAYLAHPREALLFLGASGNFRQQEGWTVNYKFAGGVNETNIVICDGLTVPSKNAWEYLWFALVTAFTFSWASNASTARFASA
jgi:hypothetical protein